MKITNQQLLFLYVTAACSFTIYTLTSIKDCEAYWMHDASITITKWKLLADNFYLFLLPIFIILVQRFLKITTTARLFLTDFIIALSSVSVLLFAINKPCDVSNDEHYMFISVVMAMGYYLLRFISLLLTGIIIIQTIILKNKANKTTQV